MKVFLSFSLEVWCSRFWKEALGPLVPVLFQELRQRCGGAILPVLHPGANGVCREFSFHYRELKHQMSKSGPNGSGCIWSQPIKQINEQLQLGLLVLLPFTAGQQIGISSQKPQKARSRRWRVARRKRPQGRHPVAFTAVIEFPVKWDAKERREHQCTSTLQSPSGRSHTLRVEPWSLYWTRVAWTFSWEQFSQNGEIGQMLFIILTSLTPLLSPKTKAGQNTNGWQMVPFSRSNSGLATMPTECFFEASR